MTETIQKLARLRAWMKARKLSTVALSTRANFAWLSGGGDNHVVSQSERGFGALVVNARQAWVVATCIELERLHAEERLADFKPVGCPWTGPLAPAIAKLAGGSRYGADDPGCTGGQALPGDFADEVRSPLTEHEVRRFKALGRDCALSVETVARQLQPGDSEHQAEADLARHLLARGIQPTVVLVAFDQRIQRWRHPVPTANHLKKHAMLVACGQRGGLVASLTRLVHFGAPTPDLLKRHEACCRIEAALWAATVPGATWGKALQAGIDRYKKEGFAKEWELHHQGGPAGYAARDLIATPGEKRKVKDGQAVAWNPSITGTKSEDTYIIQGAERVVVTAASSDWPTIAIPQAGGGSLLRPAILVR